MCYSQCLFLVLTEGAWVMVVVAGEIEAKKPSLMFVKFPHASHFQPQVKGS